MIKKITAGTILVIFGAAVLAAAAFLIYEIIMSAIEGNIWLRAIFISGGMACAVYGVVRLIDWASDEVRRK